MRRPKEQVLAYLPYEVQYTFRCAMDAANDRTGELLIDDSTMIDRVLKHSEYFLVLKPMEDLEKDEEFQQFVNEELICGAWRFEKDEHEEFSTILKIKTTESDVTLLVIGDEVAPECPVLLYRWMLEHHYDVFGMIPQRQAFDINRLDD